MAFLDLQMEYDLKIIHKTIKSLRSEGTIWGFNPIAHAELVEQVSLLRARADMLQAAFNRRNDFMVRVHRFFEKLHGENNMLRLAQAVGELRDDVRDFARYCGVTKCYSQSILSSEKFQSSERTGVDEGKCF